MCARYTLFDPSPVLVVHYDLGDLPEVNPRYNIAPSQPVLAVGYKADGKTLATTFFHWGFVPHWAGEANGPRPVNAKMETLAENPVFRESFRKRRCIIPASGYYEWVMEGKKKIPMFIRRKDLQPISFAGIWDCWKRGMEKWFTCAIITTAANDLTRSLHDRMPVILSRENHAAWLNPNTTDPAVLSKLLSPCPDEVLEIIPANPWVNNSRHEGPECLIVP